MVSSEVQIKVKEHQDILFSIVQTEPIIRRI